MPDEQDQPGITGPSYPPPSPPPTTTPLMGFGFALLLAAALALVAGRGGAALWLALVGLIATIVVLALLMRGQDQPGIVGPLPPPPRKLLVAITAVLALATVLALLGDRGELAGMLAILGAGAGGIALGLMYPGSPRS